MAFNFPDCPIPPGSTAWAYIRDSGGDSQDLASQRAYVLAYCLHHNLNLLRTFEDAAISGGSVAGREQFEAMIDQAHQGGIPHVDAILFWDIKRFARNELDSKFYKADLRRRGYRLISLSDEIPDNEFSGVFEAFLEWKAAKDRADIAKDTRRGLHFIVGMKDESGNYLGLAPGPVPKCFIAQPYDTGLARNDGSARIISRWIPDPDTWQLGQLAFEMRANGQTYKQIEAATGLFPSSLNPSSSYYGFFKNRIYIGEFRYGKQTYKNFVPALISQEIFNQVQSQFYTRPKKGGSFSAAHPKIKTSPFILSGLCHCLYCQARMHGNTSHQNREKIWRGYVCATRKARPDLCPESKQVNAQKLENAVIDGVLKNVLTSDFLAALTGHINDAFDDPTHKTRLAQAENEVTRLNRAISNLLDMIEQNPHPSLLERLTKREAERDQATTKLNRLKSTKTNLIKITPDLIKSILTDMKLRILSGQSQVQKQILNQCLKKIEVGRTNARLHLTFPLDQFGGFYFGIPTGIEVKPITVQF